jgi:hypothetical protein
MTIKTWFVRGAVVAAVAFGSSASAQTADIFSVEYVQANLVAGQTTKQQVLQSFGDPTSKKAKLSSSGGAAETFVYLKNAPKKASSGGTGFGKMLGSLRGVVSDVSDVTGKDIGGSVSANSYRAQRSANAADRLASRAGVGADEEEAAESDGASKLTIQLQGGVVSSFEME